MKTKRPTENEQQMLAIGEPDDGASARAEVRETGAVGWTPSQRAAIDLRGADILVSAAAGAGKTAVLVERIVSRILDAHDPADVTTLLVVTFTEAAAAEMRARIIRTITDKLAEDPGNAYLNRQIALAEGAAISTLHSFCLRVVRQHYHRLQPSLDPGFSIIDENEDTLLRQEVLDTLYEQFYDDLPGFTDLLRIFSDRDEGLSEGLLRIYDTSRSLPWPEEWLKSMEDIYALDDDAARERWLKPLLEAAAEEAGHLLRLTERNLVDADAPGGPEPYRAALESDRLLAGTILAKAREGDWDGLVSCLSGAGTESLGRVKSGSCDAALVQAVKDRRERFKKILASMRGRFSRSESQALQGVRDAAPQVRTLIEAVRRFQTAYSEAKRRRRLLDFSDLEQFCLQLLRSPESAPGRIVPSDIALEYRDRYHEVLVDEYQDINELQDALLGLVSRGEDDPDLFMVGDVKQSIYRFRLTDPTIFQRRYDTFSTELDAEAAGALRVDLPHNFRSLPHIVAGVNYIFKEIMVPEFGGVDYGKGHELRLAGTPAPQADGSPVEVLLLETDGPEEASSAEDEEAGDGREDWEGIELEAALIAERIRAMVHSAEPLVVREKNGNRRPVAYRDIAVLLRAAKVKANMMLEVLQERGIPASADLGSGYFNSLEVETMVSALQIVDNPRQDIHLAAVLRSPLVGMSAEDLLRIRLLDRRASYYDALRQAAAEEGELSIAVSAFLSRLESWRTLARRRPLADLIWRIYSDTGYLAYVGGLPGGAARRANLRALYDRAREFGGFSRQGLFRFLRFIEKLRQAKGDLGAARALGENEDVVRIMSIHKSKGLEFPVVFLADLGKGFNFQDTRGSLVIHPRGGIGLQCYDEKLRIRYPNALLQHIACRQRLDGLAEEMRILYVAMTRARDHLVLTGSVRDLEKSCAAWGLSSDDGRASAYSLKSARCFLDWIMPCLMRHPAGAGLPGFLLPDGGEKDGSAWKISVRHPSDAPRTSDTAAAAVKAVRLAGDGERAGNDVCWDAGRIIDWRYPFLETAVLPAKMGIGRLRDRLKPQAPGSDWDDEELAGSMALPGARKPDLAGSGSSGGAVRAGSVNHAVLQHLDLSSPLDEGDVKAQAAGMVEREIILPEDLPLVLVSEIAAFFAGELGTRLKAGRDLLRREQPFSLLLDASGIYDDLPPELLQDEKVSISGVIDCLLPDDRVPLIIDYKTDRADGTAGEEDALNRYAFQMEIYCRAVREILGCDEVEAWLYLLRQGKAIRVGNNAGDNS